MGVMRSNIYAMEPITVVVAWNCKDIGILEYLVFLLGLPHSMSP